MKQIKVRPSEDQAKSIQAVMEQLGQSTASKTLVTVCDEYLRLVKEHEALQKKADHMYDLLRSYCDRHQNLRYHAEIVEDLEQQMASCVQDIVMYMEQS